MDGIERTFNKQNAADEARRARVAARRLTMQDVRAESLDEISDDLGTMRAGEFLALSEGDRPTDADATGAFMSAEGEVFGDLTVNVGTVKQGQPAAGFNTDGDFFAALGALTINEEGQTMTGTGFPLRFDASDGSENRRARLGMYLEDGETGPNCAWSYGDTAEYDVTVPNGDFESGDFTGWTATSGSQVVAVPTIDPSKINASAYCAQKASYPSSNLTTDYITVTGGAAYRFRAKVYGALAPTMQAKWYTSGNTLISTASKAMRAGYWVETIFDTTAPANAAKVKINFVDGPTVIDDVKMENLSMIDELRFGDAGLNYNRGLWPEHHWCGWDAAQAWGPVGGGGFARKTMTRGVFSSQYCGFVGWVTTADSADGDWYILRVPLAAGTYTFELCGCKFTGCGKGDLYVDGVKVSGATPFDFYAASADVNSFWTVSGITVAKHGVHEFKVVVNGKNASSSYYRVGASYVCIKRTG